ncbi:MAG: sigma-54-dependent transcriptional regulator [Planctomycetota bacterium]|jgi:DNA-binding NtrC family response regulator
MKILIIDDAEDSRESLKELVLFMGHDAHYAVTGEEGLERCRNEFFPLIITDVRMPGMSGIELLTRLKQHTSSRDSDVVIITGHGDKDTAVAALRQGAYDYLDKPINAKEMAALIDRCCERRSLLEENRTLTESFQQEVATATQEIQQDLQETRQRLLELECGSPVIAASPVMQQILKEVAIYHRDSTLPVLIHGETGTGKEVIARLIHYGGLQDHQVGQPFIDINCAAISGELFESELFGYASGAFTGGRKEGAKGKLELAGEGTLFLDEIGEMPLHLQPKLLRVLQEKTYYSVGGSRKKTCKARIVAATNQNLESMIEAGTFRRDLYHRINVAEIYIPPLRERPEDISALSELFLHQASTQRRKTFQTLSEEALDLLQTHRWEGNVRELNNAIERAVLIYDDETLRPEHLTFVRGGDTTASVATPSSSLWEARLPDETLDLESFNLHLIQQALKKFDGHKGRAAAYLNLSRDALRRRLNRKK